MSMQKYTAQHLSQDTGQPNGGRRMMFGPESVYLAKDADAELARYNTAIEWCLQNSATHGRHWSNERQCFYPGITDQGGRPLQVPTALADLIVAVAGDNGEEETHS